jgi:hypothetical protein
MADYSTQVGRVRLLTADLADDPLLSDEMLQGYLDLNDDDANLAAADALDAIAISEVLVAKKIRTQDLSTDGPAVAKALRDQAEALRVRAGEASGSFFGVVGTFVDRNEGTEWPL